MQYFIPFLFAPLVATVVGLASPLEYQSAEAKEYKQTISEEMRETLSRLAFCESSNNPNARVLDTNGKYSYGKYQWQEDSFWRYNEKYKVFPDLERNEVLNVIYDETAQDNLTALVLKEKNGAYNWKNCAKKIRILEE